MGKKDDEKLAAGLARRKPIEAIEDDIGTTVIGMEAQAMKNATPLPLAQIEASPYQMRARLDQQHIDHLAESIRSEGLLTPILVRPLPAAPSGGPRYQLVAGHNRFEAFKLLNLAEIPALVRVMTDAEAARALATENTARSNLSDWELYKHMLMLRQVARVESNSEMARVLNVSRTQVVQMTAYGALPPAAVQLVEQHPGLVGYNMMYKLQGQCSEHPELVVAGLERVAAGKLKQTALYEWIERKAAGKGAFQRREVRIGAEALGIRLASTSRGVTLTSAAPLDFDRLQQLIEQHLDQLVA